MHGQAAQAGRSWAAGAIKAQAVRGTTMGSASGASPRVPVHDNHFHCRPDGWKGLGAVRQFMAAGGTSIAHVRLPSYPTTAEAFVESCRRHIAFGAQIRAETGCRVWTAVGPYPLEVLEVAKAQGWTVARD